MSSTLPNKNKKENRLTAEQTIILIRLIKKYKFLWDPNHVDFRNLSVCNHFYEKIGKYFQITGEEVRRKFGRLRNCYRQELKLIRDGQKTYTKMFYFEEMEFLKGQIEERLLKRKSWSCEDGDTQGYPEDSHDTLYTLEFAGCQRSNNETDSSASMEVERLEEEANNIPSEEEEQNEEVSGFSEGKPDEFDAFAGYLASQLREMDKLSALETMEELQQVVSKRRISILKRDLDGRGDLDVTPKRCRGDDAVNEQ